MSNHHGISPELLNTMLNDALTAVEALYGEEGLIAVTRNMKMAARARDRNAEIGAIEATLGRAHKAPESK